MTRRKLAEAKFFLAHLEEQRTTQHDWAAFTFYFSAFISAARSVPWVFRAEDRELYDRVQPAWHNALSQDDRDLLDFMNERRLDVVKRKGAELEGVLELVAIMDARLKPGDWQVPMVQFGTRDAPTPQVGVLTAKFELAGQPADVVATCRRYVELLESLVRAREQLGRPATQ